MKKKLLVFIAATLALCLCTAAGVATWRMTAPAQASADGALQEPVAQRKYTLYIGICDDITGELIMPVADAQAQINEICLRYAPGFTSYEAKGARTNPDGHISEQATLVYIICGIDEAGVKSIMDESMELLRQNSMMVEVADTSCIYYVK